MSISQEELLERYEARLVSKDGEVFLEWFPKGALA